MTTRSKNNPIAGTEGKVKIVGIGIVIVQLIDILLHAATHQLELLRVSSNLVILLWLAITASGRLNTQFRLSALVSIAAYLVLNLVFMGLFGVTNPEQGGAFRVSLFVLIIITVVLSGLFTLLRDKSVPTEKN
jgi:hypothetical protein